MKLNELSIGSTATILTVGGSGALRQHFLDMGLIQGTEVTVVKYAPMGDPIELRIHGYELTIRLEDAGNIEISQPHSPKEIEKKAKRREKHHPGYGEGGKYHNRKEENALPDSETLTFALVGNQNCGKTTLFNQLTGSKQHVGNFPGVTVDRKDGVIKGHENTLITDLPGIYSMSPYSSEEIVTREFVLRERPRGIINIVDATNIERNLYLTMQLLELGFPMVVALNMMDELRENGGSVRVNEMEEALGVPVIPISAAKGEGIEELIRHAIHVAKYQECPLDTDFCKQSEGIHRGIHAVMHLIEDHGQREQVPVRFAASKIMEGDTQMLEKLKLTNNEQKLLEDISRQTEEETGMDRAAAVAQMRFDYIEEVCSETVIKPRESKERIRSRKMDEFLTGKYTGIPAFIGIMGLVFWLTFNVIGAFLQGVLETGITMFTDAVDMAMQQANISGVLHSLVIDGIFSGVGGVLSFLPIIVTLFFFLSLLEDSGYMARVAFIMDKLLRKLGLSGRSIVPMLIGFGCTVPGVMASRTLPSERDRKMTILLTPFMSCTAKLPIYAFFTAAFFPEYGALVMIILYLSGIAMGIVMALIFKKTAFKGEAVPFVMELPNYRMPGAQNVFHLLWDKAKDFLQRAFTVIFIATIVIWFLQNFDMSLNMVSDSQNSILAIAAGMLAPLFIPVGFGDWRIVTALISGFLAKESVVSSLTVLFGSTAALQESLTAVGAAALLAFCLLYTPCVAAIASVKRELGTKWAAAMAAGQCLIAWIAAFVVYHIGIMF
ncbi:MAG: ferrous iron transport protein B [Lachnospiraceae bacterium]